MTSTRPYLIRAFFEWIIDNNMTPYVVIDASFSESRIPTEYVEDDRLVLNVSPAATNSLDISNDDITFEASFSGKIMSIYAPIHAVVAIYAKENGRGMIFGEEDQGGDIPPSGDGGSDGGGSGSTDKRPHLRVVK